MRRATLLSLLLLIPFALPMSGRANAQSKKADPITGRWDATLTSPAGEVPFGLELKLKGGEVSGAVLNGPERQAFTSGSFDGNTLALRFDYYDGQITAQIEVGDRTQLSGEYTRQTSQGVGRYPFKAVRTPETPNTGAATAARLPSIDGEWILTLKDETGKTLEVDRALFSQRGPGRYDARDRDAVTGTVIPVSGDYGLLSGTVWKEGGLSKFRMSRFDGIHVTLLDGELASDGSIRGVIATGQTYKAAFSGTRAAAAASGPKLDDPFAVTKVRDSKEPFRFRAPDARGKAVSSADPRFAGKVVLVDVFGTWCPNCHDEAPFLQELYRKYGKDGLEVVGLAYEYTDDAARNRRQLDIFQKKYGITFPLLIAGTTGDGEIARTLPQLDGFAGYPTTIFVGRDGRVRKIHAGYSGPATGKHFDEVKREIEALVRDLLAEKK